MAFSDGRVLCYLIHHYHPSLLPEEAVSHSTTQTVECSQRGRLELNCSASDSDNSFDSLPTGLNGTCQLYAVSLVQLSVWMYFLKKKKKKKTSVAFRRMLLKHSDIALKINSLPSFTQMQNVFNLKMISACSTDIKSIIFNYRPPLRDK